MHEIGCCQFSFIMFCVSKSLFWQSILYLWPMVSSPVIYIVSLLGMVSIRACSFSDAGSVSPKRQHIYNPLLCTLSFDKYCSRCFYFILLLSTQYTQNHRFLKCNENSFVNVYALSGYMFFKQTQTARNKQLYELNTFCLDYSMS